MTDLVPGQKLLFVAAHLNRTGVPPSYEVEVERIARKWVYLKGSFGRIDRLTLVADGGIYSSPPITCALAAAKSHSGWRRIDVKHAELIERLKAAPEGSRELDALIWITVLPRDGRKSPVPDDRFIYALASGYNWSYSAREDGIVEMYPTERDGERGMCHATRKSPRFTTSLDAALTLVPAGMWWTIAAGKMTPDEPLFGAAIYRPGLDYLAISSPIVGGEHPTSAAIALCVAALGV